MFCAHFECLLCRSVYTKFSIRLVDISMLMDLQSLVCTQPGEAEMDESTWNHCFSVMQLNGMFALTLCWTDLPLLPVGGAGWSQTLYQGVIPAGMPGAQR